MARLLRFLARLVIVTVLIVVATLAGLRGLAALRETADPGQTAGEAAHFIEVNGLRLHYRQWGPEDGPPLVLIHGTLAWAETWQDIAIPLGEAGWRVIAPDLPPFGYSQRPADGDYSHLAQARLILGFADALELDGFALAGHSFGGGATVEAAMAAPRRVSALILLDVALGLDAQPLNGALRGLLAIGPLRDALTAATFANPWLTGYGLRAFIADDAPATPERIALYRRPLTVRGTTSATGDWLATGLFGHQSGTLTRDRANYRNLAMPTLVIWGREDTVTPLAQGEEIAALLPRASLVVLDGVNHIPHLEQPDSVVREILAFLMRTEAAGTAGLRLSR
jgi:pimeloyl-ACP methyl ester carboxylesterase